VRRHKLLDTFISADKSKSKTGENVLLAYQKLDLRRKKEAKKPKKKKKKKTQYRKYRKNKYLQDEIYQTIKF